MRRRRKWPWFALATLLCCCGCPAWFGMPYYEQFPSGVVIPQTVGDLRLREDAASKAAAEKLKLEVRGDNWLAQDTFAALFTDGNGKRATVYGRTGVQWSLDSAVVEEINRVSGRYGLSDIQPVDGTLRDEQRRCGVGREDGVSVVVCSWADHGSVGTGVFTRLDVADSNNRLTLLRDTLVTRQAQK